MDLILRTCSSNPNDNGDADYAIVRINPEFAQRAVERVERLHELKQQDLSLCEMVYVDHTPNFFRWHESLRDAVDLGYDAIEAVVDTDGYAMLETDYTVPEDAHVNVENKSVVARDDGICWKAYLKQTDIRVVPQ